MEKLVRIQMGRLLALKVKVNIGERSELVAAVVPVNIPLPPRTVDNKSHKIKVVAITTEGEVDIGSASYAGPQLSDVILKDVESEVMYYEALGMSEDEIKKITCPASFEVSRKIRDEV